MFFVINAVFFPNSVNNLFKKITEFLMAGLINCSHN